eukprot:966080-Rhodomonas_salina.1
MCESVSVDERGTHTHTHTHLELRIERARREEGAVWVEGYGQTVRPVPEQRPYRLRLAPANASHIRQSHTPIRQYANPPCGTLVRYTNTQCRVWCTLYVVCRTLYAIRGMLHRANRLPTRIRHASTPYGKRSTQDAYQLGSLCTVRDSFAPDRGPIA